LGGNIPPPSDKTLRVLSSAMRMNFDNNAWLSFPLANNKTIFSNKNGV